MKKPSKHQSLSQTLLNLETQSQREKHQQNLSSKDDTAPWLGLDYGAKFCGLAYSPDGIIMVPIDVFPTEGIEETVDKTIKERNIKSLIIGSPVSNDSEAETTMVDWVKKNTKKLANRYQVYYINERGSSQSAIGSGKTKQQKNRLDDLAALNILEYFQQQQRRCRGRI